MAYFQNGSDCEETVKAYGREKEARKTAKELLRINPKFSAESFATRLP